MLQFLAFFAAAMLVVISAQLSSIGDRLKESFPTIAERELEFEVKKPFQYWGIVSKGIVILAALTYIAFLWNR